MDRFPRLPRHVLPLAALAVAPTAALSVAIVLQLVAGVVQIRFCWYLRGGRGADIGAMHRRRAQSRGAALREGAR